MELVPEIPGQDFNTRTPAELILCLKLPTFPKMKIWFDVALIICATSTRGTRLLILAKTTTDTRSRLLIPLSIEVARSLLAFDLLTARESTKNALLLGTVTNLRPVHLSPTRIDSIATVIAVVPIAPTGLQETAAFGMIGDHHGTVERTHTDTARGIRVHPSLSVAQ